MIRIEKNGIHYFQFPEFATKSNITHFVSTRLGGFSEPPYNFLNIGLDTDDSSVNVIENRRKLAYICDTELENFVFLEQVHSNKVYVVETKDKGRGTLDYKDSIPDADAMITNQKGICLTVLSADCVPILLFDPEKNVIGAVHAGWKGTAGKIIYNTVRKMQEKYSCEPANIIAGIGPSNGPCCYEVGADVEEAVQAAFGTTHSFLRINNVSGKPHFDMWYTNRNLLIEAGIRAGNIHNSSLCSQCNSDLFFSYRKDKGITGRFGAGIMLK